jgi:hypothetical protein
LKVKLSFPPPEIDFDDKDLNKVENDFERELKGRLSGSML